MKLTNNHELKCERGVPVRGRPRARVSLNSPPARLDPHSVVSQAIVGDFAAALDTGMRASVELVYEHMPSRVVLGFGLVWVWLI